MGEWTTFFRLLKETDKAAALEAEVRAVREGRESGRRFEVDPRSFGQVPTSPFAYWVSERVRRLFKELPPFEGEGRTVKQGLASADEVFDPDSDTILPGGIYTFSLVNIRPGVTVSVTGDITFNVTGDLVIAGVLTGNCVDINLYVQKNIIVTGTVDNRCKGEWTEPGDLRIYNYEGDFILGTEDTPAVIQTSGNLDISNDPTIQEWEFDVLPDQRSSTPLPPVCSAWADTLVDMVIPISPTEVLFFGEGADPDGGPVTYHWDFGDGASSTERDPLHGYTVTGTHDVVLTVTDDEGQTCRATLRLVLGDEEANFPPERPRTEISGRKTPSEENVF